MQYRIRATVILLAAIALPVLIAAKRPAPPTQQTPDKSVTGMTVLKMQLQNVTPVMYAFTLSKDNNITAVVLVMCDAAGANFVATPSTTDPIFSLLQQSFQNQKALGKVYYRASTKLISYNCVTGIEVTR